MVASNERRMDFISSDMLSMVAFAASSCNFNISIIRSFPIV